MIKISINFKGKKFKAIQEIVHIRFKDVEMKTLNLRKKKIDSMTNLIGFENVSDLEALILDKNRITEIDKIPNLKNLKYLSIKNNNIHDIKTMEGLTSLVELNLAGNEITEISGLEYLPNLQVLHLENNQITEINNLEYLQKLEFLYFDNNQITEIKNLENLKHLSSLNLNNNQITEVKNLDKARVLRKLYLKNNQITRIFPIHLQYLDEFDISGNPFYIFLKSRFAIVNAQKIIEYSNNPEGLEKRLKVGMKNIYVPLDYSTLTAILPRNEDILYSTLCNATEVKQIMTPRPRKEKVRWKAHILLTESGCAITGSKGEKGIGTIFLEWNTIWKVKSTMTAGSVLFKRGTRLTLRPTCAQDFESIESFNNRLQSFPEFCISLWENYCNKIKSPE